MTRENFRSVNDNIYKSRNKYLYWIVVITVIFVPLWQYLVQQYVIVSTNWLLENENDNQIPSIVHFVVGQGDRKAIKHRYRLSSSFSFTNYLVFLAARRQLRPKKLYVHYYEEPNTFWWNQTKQDSEINITLVKTRLVENIFLKSIDHHAHRADIMRLEVMIKYGGIYLDMDVLALRSFDPLLNLSDVVMAHENDDGNTACNAVIIGKTNAVFLKRLYDAYQSFNHKCWSCDSVKIPGQLALIYPKEVMILPTNVFFRPNWTETNKFFTSNDYNFSSNYASHLWNKIHNGHLNHLTPNRILNGNFTLARMLLRAIGNDKFQKLKEIFARNPTH